MLKFVINMPASAEQVIGKQIESANGLIVAGRARRSGGEWIASGELMSLRSQQYHSARFLDSLQGVYASGDESITQDQLLRLNEGYGREVLTRINGARNGHLSMSEAAETLGINLYTTICGNEEFIVMQFIPPAEEASLSSDNSDTIVVSSQRQPRGIVNAINEDRGVKKANDCFDVGLPTDFPESVQGAIYRHILILNPNRLGDVIAALQLYSGISETRAVELLRFPDRQYADRIIAEFDSASLAIQLAQREERERYLERFKGEFIQAITSHSSENKIRVIHAALNLSKEERERLGVRLVRVVSPLQEEVLRPLNQDVVHRSKHYDVIAQAQINGKVWSMYTSRFNLARESAEPSDGDKIEDQVLTESDSVVEENTETYSTRDPLVELMHLVYVIKNLDVLIGPGKIKDAIGYDEGRHVIQTSRGTSADIYNDAKNRVISTYLEQAHKVEQQYPSFKPIYRFKTDPPRHAYLFMDHFFYIGAIEDVLRTGSSFILDMSMRREPKYTKINLGIMYDLDHAGLTHARTILRFYDEAVRERQDRTINQPHWLVE